LEQIAARDRRTHYGPTEGRLLIVYVDSKRGPRYGWPGIPNPINKELGEIGKRSAVLVSRKVPRPTVKRRGCNGDSTGKTNVPSVPHKQRAGPDRVFNRGDPDAELPTPPASDVKD